MFETFRDQGIDISQRLHSQVRKDVATSRAFPELMDLLKQALLIPQSTAVVERVFSKMNDISTNIRSLSQNTLDALMRISSHSGGLQEEDFDSLVECFKSRKTREIEL